MTDPVGDGAAPRHNSAVVVERMSGAVSDEVNGKGGALQSQFTKQGRRRLPRSARAAPIAATVVRTSLFVGGLLGAIDGVMASCADGRHFGAAHTFAAAAYGSIIVGFVAGLGGLLAAPLAYFHAARAPAAWGWLRPLWWTMPAPRLSAHVVALVAGLLSASLPLVPLSGWVATRLHAPGTIGLAHALLSLVCLALARGVYGIVYSLLRAFFARDRGRAIPALWLGAAALSACTGAAAAVGVWCPTLLELDLSAPSLVLAGGIVWVLLAVTTHTPKRASPGWAWWCVAASVALGFAFAASSLGAAPRLASLILGRTALAGPIARVVRQRVDRDGDGASPYFAGGDCDDRDSRRRPGRYDVPGDGVDQNCSGGDAPIEARALPSGPHLRGAPGPRPDIFLISIDALRADHLGAYGYRRPTSPHIDQFAARGVRFARAYTAAPRTAHALAAMFTGCPASLASWGAEANRRTLLPDNPLVASRLAASGYRTLAAGSQEVFQQVPGVLHGFQHTQVLPGFDGPGVAMVHAWTEAIRARREDPAPLFAWIHLAEPHEPYVRHPEVQRFGDAAVDRYDEEIAYVDRALAEVLTWVDAPPRDRPAVLILVADHGEAFGEHGLRYHNSSLHEAQTRIPMVIAGARVPRGAVEDHAISLMSVAPTLLALAQVDDDAPRCAADLSAVIRDPRDPSGLDRQVVSEVIADNGLEAASATAIVRGDFKLVDWRSRGTRSLFNLRDDPAELDDLIEANPAVAGPLLDRLDAAFSLDARHHAVHARWIAEARLREEPSPVNALRRRVGEVVELLGYDLDRTRLAVGESIRLRAYYRVLQRTTLPLFLGPSVRLSHQPDRWLWWLQAVRSPVRGVYPTTEWRPGEVLRDDYVIVLTPETAPGDYTVHFQANYDLATGHEVEPGQTLVRFPLQAITVTAASNRTVAP